MGAQPPNLPNQREFAKRPELFENGVLRVGSDKRLHRLAGSRWQFLPRFLPPFRPYSLPGSLALSPRQPSAGPEHCAAPLESANPWQDLTSHSQEWHK
jgi:hypothetical protein